ncbi:hypothetical protein [Sphingomonas solaris]|nr:hypothetical protein [Sphingomonas solaris]
MADTPQDSKQTPPAGSPPANEPGPAPLTPAADPDADHGAGGDPLIEGP